MARTYRFFYLIPEETHHRLDGETLIMHFHRILFRRKKQVPSGGVKIIYQHCEMLQKNGYEAYVVHLGDFIIDWFPHNLKPLSVKEALKIMNKDDVLICPEVIPASAEPFPCRNKIAFVQGWSLVSRGTGADKRYEDFGFTQILCCSEFVREFMKDKSALPSAVITNGIDLDLFSPQVAKRRPGTVLYLNRRNVLEARHAIELLDPELKDRTEFIELENKYTQTELVEYYRQADIFMAIGYPEGFALPPLEAMACGCAVIGYTGQGGLVHMREGETALIARDGNVEELFRCLSKVLMDNQVRGEIRMGGEKMARKFSLENMEREVVAWAESYCEAGNVKGLELETA